MLWRWLLIGAVFLYALGGVGVLIRNVGDEHFQHYEHHYRRAAYDAALWPRQLPALAREAWQAVGTAWEAL
jgi:hypothetical protein